MWLQIRPESPRTWTEEYDFAKAYHEPTFTAATVENLIDTFKADPAAQTSASQDYLRYS